MSFTFFFFLPLNNFLLVLSMSSTPESALISLKNSSTRNFLAFLSFLPSSKYFLFAEEESHVLVCHPQNYHLLLLERSSKEITNLFKKFFASEAS